MNDLWQTRVALAGAVDRAEQAIEAETNGAEKVRAENRWGHSWDALHDVDDRIVAMPAGHITEVAIKAQICLLRANEDTPYLHYIARIVSDVTALAG